MRTKGKVRKITKYKTIKQNVIVNRALINRILEEKAEEISSLQVKLKVQLKEASENTPSWIAFQKWLQKEITDTEDLKVKIRPEKQDRYQISVETLTNFCDSLEATLDKNSKDYHLFPEFDQNKSFAELFPYEKALFGKKTNREMPNTDDYKVLTELFNEFSSGIAANIKGKESSERPGENPIPSENNEPISVEEKQAIINYLDNLIMEVAKKNTKGDYSVLSSDKKFILKSELKSAQMKVLRDDEKANYEEKLKNVDINTKGKANKIRQKIFDEIVYYVSDLKGGSGQLGEAQEISSKIADLTKKEKEKKSTKEPPEISTTTTTTKNINNMENNKKELSFSLDDNHFDNKEEIANNSFNRTSALLENILAKNEKKKNDLLIHQTRLIADKEEEFEVSAETTEAPLIKKIGEVLDDLANIQKETNFAQKENTQKVLEKIFEIKNIYQEQQNQHLAELNELKEEFDFISNNLLNTSFTDNSTFATSPDISSSQNIQKRRDYFSSQVDSFELQNNLEKKEAEVAGLKEQIEELEESRKGLIRDKKEIEELLGKREKDVTVLEERLQEALRLDLMNEYDPENTLKVGELESTDKKHLEEMNKLEGEKRVLEEQFKTVKSQRDGFNKIIIKRNGELSKVSREFGQRERQRDKEIENLTIERDNLAHELQQRKSEETYQQFNAELKNQQAEEELEVGKKVEKTKTLLEEMRNEKDEMFNSFQNIEARIKNLANEKFRLEGESKISETADLEEMINVVKKTVEKRSVKIAEFLNENIEKGRTITRQQSWSGNVSSPNTPFNVPHTPKSARESTGHFSFSQKRFQKRSSTTLVKTDIESQQKIADRFENSLKAKLEMNKGKSSKPQNTNQELKQIIQLVVNKWGQSHGKQKKPAWLTGEIEEKLAQERGTILFPEARKMLEEVIDQLQKEVDEGKKNSRLLIDCNNNLDEEKEANRIKQEKIAAQARQIEEFQREIGELKFKLDSIESQSLHNFGRIREEMEKVKVSNEKLQQSQEENTQLEEQIKEKEKLLEFQQEILGAWNKIDDYLSKMKEEDIVSIAEEESDTSSYSSELEEEIDIKEKASVEEENPQIVKLKDTSERLKELARVANEISENKEKLAEVKKRVISITNESKLDRTEGEPELLALSELESQESEIQGRVDDLEGEESKLAESLVESDTSVSQSEIKENQDASWFNWIYEGGKKVLNVSGSALCKIKAHPFRVATGVLGVYGLYSNYGYQQCSTSVSELNFQITNLKGKVSSCLEENAQLKFENEISKQNFSAPNSRDKDYLDEYIQKIITQSNRYQVKAQFYKEKLAKNIAEREAQERNQLTNSTTTGIVTTGPIPEASTVTETSTVTPAPVHSTVSQTLEPETITHTSTVTPAPVHSTVSQTLEPETITHTSTVTPAPVHSTVSQPLEPETITHTVNVPATAPTSTTTEHKRRGWAAEAISGYVAGAIGLGYYLRKNKLEDKQQQQQQKDNSQINDNVYPVCSHTDYEKIKWERNNWEKQYRKVCQEKEERGQEIIGELNSTLNLNLNNPNLEQVITKIQELINKPPQTIYQEFSNSELEEQLKASQQTINHLEKELTNQTTPFGEDLAVIKSLELESLEELFNQSVDNTIKQQIQQATSYQQVVNARQAFIQKQLSKKQNTIQVVEQPQQELALPATPNKERIILISLLAVSLVSIGGLLVKLRGTSKKVLK
ncbi:hypothetical protein GvMRE_Ic2g16 [endosymbiont GvMRE of Glomus versiforme]|nr:hypothetical protein GvMRE_Ic2g16 [endosymbiont GvMRE of Glomus versiforme]